MMDVTNAIRGGQPGSVPNGKDPDWSYYIVTNKLKVVFRFAEGNKLFIITAHPI